MNVTELRDALNALIEHGHGGLRVTTLAEYHGSDYLSEIEQHIIHEHGGPELPGPVIQLI